MKRTLKDKNAYSFEFHHFMDHFSKNDVTYFIHVHIKYTLVYPWCPFNLQHCIMRLLHTQRKASPFSNTSTFYVRAQSSMMRTCKRCFCFIVISSGIYLHTPNWDHEWKLFLLFENRPKTSKRKRCMCYTESVKLL